MINIQLCYLALCWDCWSSQSAFFCTFSSVIRRSLSPTLHSRSNRMLLRSRLAPGLAAIILQIASGGQRCQSDRRRADLQGAVLLMPRLEGQAFGTSLHIHPQDAPALGQGTRTSPAWSASVTIRLAETYWKVKNGIRLSGMPSYQTGLDRRTDVSAAVRLLSQAT